MSPQSSQRREERLSKSIYSIVYFQVMMEFGVKKLVFSSSATVYGQPQYLPVDENHPTGRKLGHLKDVSKCRLSSKSSLYTGNCTNPYGKTKFFMEEIMKDVVAANPDWGCQLLRSAGQYLIE